MLDGSWNVFRFLATNCFYAFGNKIFEVSNNVYIRVYVQMYMFVLDNLAKFILGKHSIWLCICCIILTFFLIIFDKHLVSAYCCINRHVYSMQPKCIHANLCVNCNVGGLID